MLQTQDVQYLGDYWRVAGSLIADVGSRREALQLVLAMPAGTPLHELGEAARDFATQEFAVHC